jgi:hypothetical protein
MVQNKRRVVRGGVFPAYAVCLPGMEVGDTCIVLASSSGTGATAAAGSTCCRPPLQRTKHA